MFRRVRPGWLLLLAPLALTIAWTGLNHDVRFVLGTLRTAGRAGFSPSEVFVHRPLAYRLVLAAGDAGSTLPVPVREAVVRVLALVVVLLVALLLRAGLRRYRPAGEATAVAAATGVALALAPNWDFLQPEWLAAVFAAGGAGAALRISRLVPAALAGGLLLALAVLVKYTTAPTAVVALGVVAVLDRRRAVLTGVLGVLVCLGLFGLSVLIEPREWRWLGELSFLNGGSPLSRGWALSDAQALAGTLLNEALVVPAVALLPVSVAVLARLAEGRRARLAWLLLPAAAVLVVLAAVVVQGQWFQYHLAALVPFAAALAALAVVRWSAEHGGPSRALVLPAIALGIGMPLVSAATTEWRLAHGTPVYAALVVLVVASVLLALKDRGRTWPVAAVLGASALLAVPVWPSAPYSFDAIHPDYTNSERVAAAHLDERLIAPVRDRIGADTPVVFLAFGDMAYFFGNPAACRYPAPVFVQRGTYLPAVRGLASYRENLDCLERTDAGYLVVQPSWLALDRLPADVAAGVHSRFDCERALTAGELIVCPRR
ncbi:hypothetical protein [Amycolatopsis rifamycinica]|uniref:Glycosyltransferase RgtA/B/C/D-like domain-containing protein n=1 Tax=Amycolatopsis rifamycinica TaxID=287986 RepID=A0A066TT38_9PSEU|nr:hypothetical protein [Amycolatopsis rifamycinica]KDN16682.1 hypothetical protein DV20_39900 [Amycolatopsis rifamycinica]